MFYAVRRSSCTVRRKYYTRSIFNMSNCLQTAFVICYMLFAPLFGYLGDRHSRKMIMAVGVLIWVAATLIGSFMTVSLYVEGSLLIRAEIDFRCLSRNRYSKASLFANVFKQFQLSILLLGIS